MKYPIPFFGLISASVWLAVFVTVILSFHSTWANVSLAVWAILVVGTMSTVHIKGLLTYVVEWSLKGLIMVPVVCVVATIAMTLLHFEHQWWSLAVLTVGGTLINVIALTESLKQYDAM